MGKDGRLFNLEDARREVKSVLSINTLFIFYMTSIHIPHAPMPSTMYGWYIKSLFFGHVGTTCIQPFTSQFKSLELVERIFKKLNLLQCASNMLSSWQLGWYILPDRMIFDLSHFLYSLPSSLDLYILCVFKPFDFSPLSDS